MNTPSNNEHTRIPRWRRNILIGFASLVSIFFLCALTVHLWIAPALLSDARPKLEKIIEEQCQCTASIQKFSLHWFPLGVVVHGLSARIDAHSTIEATKIGVYPQLFSLLGDAPEIHAIDLSGLRFSLDFNQWHPWETASGETSNPFEMIRKINLHDIHGSITYDQWHATLHDLTVTLKPRSQSTHIDLKSLQFDWVYKDHNASFSVSTQATLHGELTALEAIAIERGTVRIDDAHTLSLQGHIPLNNKTDINAQATLQADLNALSHTFLKAPLLMGKAHFDLRASGNLAHPKALLNAHLTDIALNKRPIGVLDAQAIIDEKQVDLTKLTINTRDMGQASASAIVALGAHYPTHVELKLDNLSLEHLLDLCDVDNSWVRMRIHAFYVADGTLWPFQFRGPFNAHVPRFDSIDRGYRDPKAEVMLRLEQANIETDLTVTPSAATLDNGVIHIGKTNVHVEGSMHYSAKRQGYDLQISDHDFRLSDLGPIARIPFGGKGSVNATITGPIDDPDIIGRVQLTELAIADLTLGDTQAQLRYNHQILHIEQATTQHGVQLQGSLDFNPTPIIFDAQASLHDTDFRGLLLNLNLVDAMPTDIKIPLSGNVHLHGPFMALIGDFEATIQSGNIASIPITRTHATGNFGPGGSAWSAHINSHMGEGKLAGTVTYASPNLLSLEIGADRLPIGILTHGAAIGKMSGQVLIHGPIDKPTGGIELELHQLGTYAGIWGDARIEATIDRGTATWKAHTHRQKVKGEGMIRLGTAGGEQKSTWHLKDISLHDFGAPLPSASDIRLSGIVNTSGPAWPLSAWTIQSQWQDGTVRWHATTLKQRDSFHINRQNNRIEISDVLFHNDALTLAFHGNQSADHQITATLNLQGPFQTNEKLIPGIESLRGTIDTRIQASGTLEKPLFNGNLTFQNGVVGLQSIGHLDDVNMRIALQGKRIDVQAFTATLGKGHVNIHGNLDFFRDTQPSLNLQAEIDQITLQPFKDLDSILSGKLNLTGPWKHAKLDGNVTINALRFTRAIDIKSLIPNRRTYVRPETGVDHLALGIRFHAPGNILLNNNLIETELRIDTTLTGTVGKPGLIGSITPLWGRVKYRNNTFNIDRAMLDFIDENSIKTFFDIEASTNACGIAARITIQGSDNKYTFIASGQDPQGTVSPSDVISCLQFGIRLREFAGPNTKGVGLAVPGGLDALWTVTGLDSEVKKRLPIAIDQFRLTSRWSSISRTTTSWVLVGKNLSKNFELQYARSLQNVDEQELNLRYNLSSVSTIASSWTINNLTTYGDLGLDLNLSWMFD